jgi:hypothetical protein
MFCPKCGAENVEGSNYCRKCGAHLGSVGSKVSDETEQINVAFPDSPDLHLKIRVGACRLKVKPGESANWVTGSYFHPAGLMPSKVEHDGGTVKISQQHDVTDVRIVKGTPRFDLLLGKARPYALTLETGASESSFDLGGLPLTEMTVRHGAGRFDIDFSAPNPKGMKRMDVNAGAVGMEMKNLANANFAEMIVEGGAASYKFDFGGTLSRDASARISTGMSSVEIRIPSGTAAKITSKTVLGSLDVGDGYTKREGGFWTEAAVGGRIPVLTINASMSLGTLSIRAT